MIFNQDNKKYEKIALKIIDSIPTKLYKFVQMYPLSNDYLEFGHTDGISIRFSLSDKIIGVMVESEENIFVYLETKDEIKKLQNTNIQNIKDIILKEIKWKEH